MSSVMIKNNAARTYIFRGRDNGGCIQCITIRPMANAKAYQTVDSKIWDLVKGQKLVEDAIDRGFLVIKKKAEIREDDEVVNAEVLAKRVTGDSLVKGKEATEKEDAEKAGDDENTETVDDDPDDQQLPENVDALLESLGDIGTDDLKAALKDYADKKHDGVNFGNSGVPKMIEKIKEAESDVD